MQDKFSCHYTNIFLLIKQCAILFSEHGERDSATESVEKRMVSDGSVSMICKIFVARCMIFSVVHWPLKLVFLFYVLVNAAS